MAVVDIRVIKSDTPYRMRQPVEDASMVVEAHRTFCTSFVQAVNGVICEEAQFFLKCLKTSCPLDRINCMLVRHNGFEP